MAAIASAVANGELGVTEAAELSKLTKALCAQSRRLTLKSDCLRWNRGSNEIEADARETRSAQHAT